MSYTDEEQHIIDDLERLKEYDREVEKDMQKVYVHSFIYSTKIIPIKITSTFTPENYWWDFVQIDPETWVSPIHYMVEQRTILDEFKER